MKSIPPHGVIAECAQYLALVTGHCFKFISDIDLDRALPSY